ncbi:hypothetical protein [Bacillus sp. CHD6a]|nr:hypothetical protein [Bacillus sp. CHD6a]
MNLKQKAIEMVSIYKTNGKVDAILNLVELHRSEINIEQQKQDISYIK